MNGDKAHRQAPNPSEGSPQGESQSRPIASAACGPPADAGTGGHARIVKVPRVLRVQLADMTDDVWMGLRALAREGARFCNGLLADQYAQALGYQPPVESAFRRLKGTLSGDVRVALQREAWTAWRRHRGRILDGAQRLALFQADRALVCRGEHLHQGRRQRHAWIFHDGDRYWLSVCLRSQASGGRQAFVLWWKSQIEAYVRPVLEDLASGKGRLLKVSFLFERPGRKVFALVCYERTLMIPVPGDREATLGPLEVDGSLYLRATLENGRPFVENYAERILRWLQMKQHFAGLHKRLRLQRRQSGSGWRQRYRRDLLRVGSFEAWAHGRLQELSADVVETCRRLGIGKLAVGPMEFGELPMAKLIGMLTYKCEEAGISLVRFDPVQPTTERAIEAPIRKRGRKLAKARQALSDLRDVIQP